MSLKSQNLEKFSLEYADNVPDDYGVSKIRYTFDFIRLVLKKDYSIDDAVKEVAGKYGLSKNDLKAYLIENKYVLNSMKRNEFSNHLKKHNTKSLKKILKKHGLKTSGKRERIEKRVIENNLIANSYRLSSKSKVFYKNKKRRIGIFEKHLIDYYYFNEFNEFYMDNYRKKLANIPIEFIRLHIERAAEDKNHENYISNNSIMAKHFLKSEKYRKALEYVLKNYCMNLNPIWMDELQNHCGLSQEIYDDLIFLCQNLSKNIVINAYYIIWDSFDFEKIIVSKYDGYRYLKDILNLKDYNRIIKDMQNRFYANEDLKIKKITQKTLFDF